MRNKIFCHFLIVLLLGTHGGFSSTSPTDTKHYRSFCLMASRDDEIFRCFKKFPQVIHVFDHLTEFQGVLQLNFIIENYPDLLEFFPLFQKNDSVGDPKTYSYEPFGDFSPTTLRYIKIAGELGQYFGDLNNLRVIEIGVGCGGQCKILSDLYSFKEYILVDLPEVLELAKRYLQELGVNNVVYLKPDEIPAEGTYDLVISNYSFSECYREIQKDYMERVLALSKRGYMICNYDDNSESADHYSFEQVLEELRHFGKRPIMKSEKPETSIRLQKGLEKPKNVLYLWGQVDQQ